MANATPAILCHDSGSRKKRIPTMTMIAAPPAKIAGTERADRLFEKAGRMQLSQRLHRYR
jgi:hypothetical protein